MLPLASLLSEEGGQDDDQCMTMRETRESRDLMPDAMGRPVLCHAHRDEAIECHRRREHEGGTCIVVCRLSLDLVCLLDEGE